MSSTYSSFETPGPASAANTLLSPDSFEELYKSDAVHLLRRLCSSFPSASISLGVAPGTTSVPSFTSQPTVRVDKRDTTSDLYFPLVGRLISMVMRLSTFDELTVIEYAYPAKHLTIVPCSQMGDIVRDSMPELSNIICLGLRHIG